MVRGMKITPLQLGTTVIVIVIVLQIQLRWCSVRMCCSFLEQPKCITSIVHNAHIHCA